MITTVANELLDGYFQGLSVMYGKTLKPLDLNNQFDGIRGVDERIVVVEVV